MKEYNTIFSAFTARGLLSKINRANNHLKKQFGKENLGMKITFYQKGLLKHFVIIEIEIQS